MLPVFYSAVCLKRLKCSNLIFSDVKLIFRSLALHLETVCLFHVLICPCSQVKGFQVEYLAKVPEVKDTVHKHSLLHHLCHIVMEKFPDSTDLYSEVSNECAFLTQVVLFQWQCFSKT